MKLSANIQELESNTDQIDITFNCGQFSLLTELYSSARKITVKSKYPWLVATMTHFTNSLSMKVSTPQHSHIVGWARD